MDILEKRQQAHERAELVRRLNELLPRIDGQAAVVPSYNGALEISTETLSRIVACVEVGEGL